MSIVGKNIKARRKELQLSQRDLAEKMGYSNHSTITRIEAGQVDLPQSRILQFAEALGTTPAVLMGLASEEQKEKPAKDDGLSENKRMLIDFAKSLSEDQAVLALRLLKSLVEVD